MARRGGSGPGPARAVDGVARRSEAQSRHVGRCHGPRVTRSTVPFFFPPFFLLADVVSHSADLLVVSCSFVSPLFPKLPLRSRLSLDEQPITFKLNSPRARPSADHTSAILISSSASIISVAYKALSDAIIRAQISTRFDCHVGGVRRHLLLRTLSRIRWIISPLQWPPCLLAMVSPSLPKTLSIFRIRRDEQPIIQAQQSKGSSLCGHTSTSTLLNSSPFICRVHKAFSNVVALAQINTLSDYRVRGILCVTGIDVAYLHDGKYIIF
jgi:hypothetical protein